MGRRDVGASGGLLPLALGLGVALAAGCASSAQGGGGSSVRFVLEVEETYGRPVYVALVTASEPVAWVLARGATGRVYMESRCEVPECGGPEVVCGARLPVVRLVADAGGAGRIEYLWDGTTGVVQQPEGCERRVSAPPGRYTVRFCYAHAATIDGEGDPAVGVPGRLTRPACVERALELGRDDELALTLR